MSSKKVRERKRQSKLDFSPASKTSPTTNPSSSTVMGRSTPNKKTTSRRAGSRRSKIVQSSSSSDDELQIRTDRSMRLGLPVEITPYGMFEGSNLDPVSSESEEEQLTDFSAPRKRRRRVEISYNSDDEEDTIRVTPRTRGNRITTDTSDEEEVSNLSVKRRKTRHQRAPNRRPSPSVSDRATSEDTIQDEEVLKDTNDNESDGNDSKEEEEEDLKKDLDFLTSSPPPDRGKLRSTQEKPKNARQIALEALKKRRTEANGLSSSATPGRRRLVVLESESEVDSESELEIMKEETDAESDGTDRDDIIETGDEEYNGDGSRPANALDMFQEDQEDEDFIDDEGALIGEPSVTADLDEIRVMNHLSRTKPKELFKHAVEWMVMKRIHPAFDSSAYVYQITFRKLDDEVKLLAGSKFTSSVWKPEFTRSIQARPELDMSEIGRAAKEVLAPHCEACNRTNHVASFELMLTGAPYDAETLEPLDTGDSDSASGSDSELSADPKTHSDGEKIVYNAQGEPLPPDGRRFALGSTCKANAQVAHTLHHWRYHLYQWVKDYLDHNGHLTPENLVQRDKWSDRKRQKATQKIVDAMVTDGEVTRLYRLYKAQLDFALEVKNEYMKGWGRH